MVECWLAKSEVPGSWPGARSKQVRGVTVALGSPKPLAKVQILPGLPNFERFDKTDVKVYMSWAEKITERLK